VFLVSFFRYALFLSLSFTLHAKGQCDVELGQGVIITDSVIRITNGSQTQVQINNDKQLFIQGRLVQLTDQDMFVLKAFSTGLRNSVPELVELVTDGVNIGLNAIEKIVEGMSDQEPEVLKTQLTYLEYALKDKFIRGDDFYFIGPQSLSKLGSFFAEEVSDKMHTAIHGSLGAILLSLGDAFQSKEGNLEERITDMNERMDIISKEIDKSLQRKATEFESKADKYCECLKTLNVTEERLHKIVPQLAKFDIVKIR
jgi:hypothetical protein